MSPKSWTWRSNKAEENPRSNARRKKKSENVCKINKYTIFRNVVPDAMLILFLWRLWPSLSVVYLYIQFIFQFFGPRFIQSSPTSSTPLNRPLSLLLLFHNQRHAEKKKEQENYKCFVLSVISFASNVMPFASKHAGSNTLGILYLCLVHWGFGVHSSY